MNKLLLILSLFVCVESISQTPLSRLLIGKKTLLYDTFTDANGTNVSSHGMDIGGGWTAQQNGLCGSVSNMTIQSNKVDMSGQIFGIYTANATIANYSASFDVTTPNTSDYLGGICFRFVDCDDWWAIMIERDASGTPYLAIFESNAGTRTLRATVNVPSATNTTVNINVTISGNLITAKAITGETCSYTSSLHAGSTLVGLFGFTFSPYVATTGDIFLVTN